jgi:PAS domain S-box-containing protein
MILELPTIEKHYDILEILFNTMPYVFWKDKQGRYQGGNLNQAKNLGFKSSAEFIGKTIFEILEDQLSAQLIDDIDNKVMNENVTLVNEEKFVGPSGDKIYLTQKSPIRNDKGEVIGMLGFAMDITEIKRQEKLAIQERDNLKIIAAQKEAERLKFELEMHRIATEEQAKYRRTVDQMVHDIGTPLQSLRMLLKSCNGLDEQIRISMRESLIRIDGITRSVLNQYKVKADKDYKEQHEQAEALLLAPTLMNLISEKKHQYQDKEVKFFYEFSSESQFAFVKIQPNSFKRMVSNIMNNAVDAFEEKPGAVGLKLDVSENWIKIEIKDNGKGMSKEIIHKIMQNIAVTEGKAEGHGIGMGQVQDTLANNNGYMQISSEIGKGTNITLTFPRIEAPYWIADEIILFPINTVLVLDDDSSIHGAWKKHFERVAPNIPLKHFIEASVLIDYVKKLSPEQKENIFLLADYELLGQNLNGLDVISKTGIEDSILVTSHYGNEKVRTLAAKTRTKILPKSLASEIPIKVMTEPEIEKIDVVMLEDNDLLATSTIACYNKHQRMVYFQNPFDFLKDVRKFPKKYPKDIKITLDNDFGPNIDTDGFMMAKQLHEMGFTQLYLLTGYPFGREEFENFPYLKLIMKGDGEEFEKKLNLKPN